MRYNHIHHLHQRKRVHAKKKKGLEPLPHPNKWVHFLDESLIMLAVIGPMMTLPQIIKIIVEKSSSGVSLLTWSMYGLLAIPWLAYGIVHKEKPIIVSSALALILDVSIVVSSLVFP